MNISQLPKVELHIHLDCSISYPVARRIVSGLSEETWRRRLVAPAQCQDLSDYLTRAEAAIELLQGREALQWVTEDLFRQWQADGVMYGEMRFAPLEHCREGLRAEDVMDVVCRTMQKCRAETGIGGGLIVCSLRHYPAGRAMQAAELALAWRARGVVGFDLAGDEVHYPLAPQIPAFALARKAGLPCTAHAGEACGPQSIWEVLEHLRPRRIGHGVRCIEDPRLMEHLRDRQILLEVCPTSNLQTRVFERMEDHPIDRLYRFGIPVCINTDSRTTTPVSLCGEYEGLREVFGWGAEEFEQCRAYAWAGRFGGF